MLSYASAISLDREPNEKTTKPPIIKNATRYVGVYLRRYIMYPPKNTQQEKKT